MLSPLALRNALLIALGASPQVFAQNAQSSPPVAAEMTSLEEVVVTAGKREQRLIDVANSLSVQSGEEIEGRRAQNMEDLFKVEPGVSFQKTSPDKSFPVIRGISTGSSLNLVTVPVGIYFGDVPVSDPQNPQSVLDVSPIDMESVEILKGPQGALYGANSLAGAVRYVFRRPDLDAPNSGSLDVSITDIANGSVGYRTAATVNFANDAKTAGVRVTGWTAATPGYIDNVTAAKEASNDADNYGGRIVAEYRPSDPLSMTLIGLYQQTSTDDYYLVDKPGSLTRTGNPKLSTTRVRGAFVNLIVDYEFSNGFRLTSNTGYLDKRTANNNDITNGGLYCANFLGLAGLPVSFPYCTSLARTSGEQFFQELRLAGELGSSVSFVAGASYQTSETHVGVDQFRAPGFSQQIAPFLPPGLTPAMLGPTDAYMLGEAVQKNKEMAVFGDFEWKVTEQLALAAGGRLYRNESELPVQYFRGYYVLTIFNPGNLIYSNTFPNSAEDGFVPRFSAVYKLSDRQSLRLVGSRGYRFGGVNVIPEVGQTQQGKYDTDTIWNYEIGYRGELTSDLALDVAAYYMDWSDAQIQVTGLDGLQRVRNVGAAKVKGVEFGANWSIVDSLALRLAATYTDAKTSEPLTLSAVSTVADGAALPGTPEWATAESLTYTFSGPVQSNGELVLSHTYVGKSYSDIEHTAETGGYNLIDARIVFTRAPWQFSLFGSNLTDERKASGAVTFPAKLYTVTAPRTIGVGAKFSF